MAAVYLTIWTALALFTVAEIGRARRPHVRGWPWSVSAAGLCLAIIHTLLSFAYVHAWSHQAAVRQTAAQTEAVFGVPFGGGLYANYAFFAAWAADLALWRHGGRDRPRLIWTLRAFYLLIIVNAAIVFASRTRALMGVVMVVALLGAWGTERRRALAR